MNPAESELGLYRHLNEVAGYLDQARDVRGALRLSLRAVRDFFGASFACLALLPPGAGIAELDIVLPREGEWDLELLTGFLRDERPNIPPDVLLARLTRRERHWAVIGLRRPGSSFEKGAVRTILRIAEEISDSVHRIDRERLLEVRARIDGKVMEQLPPKDLFYQILAGLRSLTGYDHSSALLIYEADDVALRLVAEQIAWLKGKSRRIGLRLPLTDNLMALMQGDTVYGFDRAGEIWKDWPSQAAAPLARLLDYNADKRASSGADSREATMLCAPLRTRDGLLGVLKVAARHAGSFGVYEAGLLQGFMPLASVAIRNSQRTETLQIRMLEAVRKHAIVDLARGVSHDINNALGAVLPLVQQMQEDARAGRIDAELFQRDLQDIEQSLQICRRIFGGMLGFARGSARSAGQGDIRRALDGTLGVLGDSMGKRGVRVVLEVPEGLPAVRGGQGDLEQLFLNILTNARDAMPDGGRLSIGARRLGELLEVVVEDTGCGIPPDMMPKIHEPFFTTKPHGTGLGLSTSRWIIWEMRGQLKFDSTPGRGTRVTILIPAVVSDSEGGP